MPFLKPFPTRTEKMRDEPGFSAFQKKPSEEKNELHLLLIYLQVPLIAFERPDD